VLRLNIDEILNERRKKILVSLAPTVLNLLDKIIEEHGLVDEDDKPYPRSWLIEDMILWIISDKERLEQFIKDNFEEEE